MKRILVGLSTAFVFAALNAQAADPIRIGVPTSLSGPYALIGEQAKRGVTYAVNEVNAKGGINGRLVEANFADDESNPEAGRRVAERLAMSGSKILVGIVSSAVSLAVGGQLERWDALYVASISKSDRITGAECNPRMFRANHNDSMDMAMIGPWLKARKEKDWAIIAADYTWGHDSANGFIAAAAASGKTIKGKFFPPLGAKDFAPFIQPIAALKPDAVWVAFSGRDAINLIGQANSFGLTKSAFIAAHTIAGDQTTISGIGEPALGIVGIVNYTSTIDTPGNKAFVADWMKANNGKEPGIFEAQTYVAMKLIFASIAKAGSSEPAAVAKAMETISIDTPFYGQVSMRAEDHQLRLPNYIGRVARVGSELKPVIEQRVDAMEATPPSKDCKMRR